MRLILLLTILLLIFPLSLKSQDVLNIPGRKYVSVSGQYFNEFKSVELGYNKFTSGVRGFSIKGRYLNSINGCTNYQSGLLSLSAFNKLFNISEFFYMYAYGGVSGGYEFLESTVESVNEDSFPIYGLSLGAYIELRLIRNLSLTFTGDINNLWNSKAGNGYYTTRIGFNYYL